MHDDEPDLEDVARLLRATRAEPSPEYVERTEVSLFGRSASARSQRPLLAALGLTGTIAGFALVAGLLGAGPLSLGGQDSVQADKDCRSIEVTTTTPVGELVEQPDGTTTVVSRETPLTATVERCR